ncbi:30088_t:CDS:2, partial [Racocetra persica]
GWVEKKETVVMLGCVERGQSIWQKALRIRLALSTHNNVAKRHCQDGSPKCESPLANPALLLSEGFPNFPTT